MMKRFCSRLLALILAAALLLPLATPMEVFAATSGSFGAGLHWKLENGCLTVSGNGAIPDYTATSKESAPWYSVRSSVKEIVIKEGITEIGDFSLFDMTSVTYVSLPDSLLSIGNQGMAYMSSLIALDIPASVETLGPACFGNCDSLKHLYVDGFETEFVWLSYGFGYDPQVNDYVSIDGVTLYGYSGSTAESYAGQYDNITFVSLDGNSISGMQPKTDRMERTDSRNLVHIYTVEDFQEIADAPDAHYILEEDLTLPADWTPVSLFGSLDGQGHTVSFSVHSSESGYYGLFSTLTGAVSNLNVSGTIRASGTDYIAAGLLASECTGDVYNCTATGSVEAEATGSAYIGGMTGRGNGSFETCTVEADVSLTVSSDAATQAYAGGLSGMEVKYAMDCAYEGDLSLTQTVDAPGLNAELGGITVSMRDKCADIAVSGSITASIMDCNYALVVALEGAANSVNRADITVTTRDFVQVYACQDTFACTNEGDVSVTQRGANGAAKAYGFYDSANCRNSGTISAVSEGEVLAEATAIYASASGYGETDLYCYNTANVTADAPNGGATAKAIDGSYEGTGSNTGAVTANGSWSALAYGVSYVTEGSNSGEITATAVDGAGSYGLTGVNSAVNSAPVTAYSAGGSAYATGISYAGRGGGSNSAPIRAEAPNGYSGATGISGVDSDAFSYTNSGAVTAIGSTGADATGISDCSYSVNLADITAVYIGSGESGSTRACGISGDWNTNTGNENRGNITAKGAPEENWAEGCAVTSESISTGNITAEGPGRAYAYGLYASENSVSSGSITARSLREDSPSAAYAYGWYGAAGCSSTASVFASADYSLCEVSSDGSPGYYSCALLYSQCEAGNAASAAIRIKGLFDITQSGGKTTVYYAWITTRGEVFGVYDHKPTLDDLEAHPELLFAPGLTRPSYECAETRIVMDSDGNASDSWTPPEPPEVEPVPDPEPDEAARPISASFYYEKNNEASRIHAMTSSLGNFSFYNGKVPDIKDPATTDYRVVYLKLQYLNSSSNPTLAGTTELTLPYGFSFEQESYQQSMTVPIPALQGGESDELWIPVYPLSFPSYYYNNNELLYCSYANGTLSTGCRVNLNSASYYSSSARINYRFEESTGRYSYVDYWWEDEIFEQDNTVFHQNINRLAALLSSVIYFTNDDLEEALKSMAALGFSCVKMGGANSVTDCVHLVAKKTLITADNKVQELEVLIILGTSSTEGWIGNAVFWETEREHRTFLSSAESAVKTLSDHVDAYASDGQERLFLVTGHSRGAAAANLAADMVNEEYEEDWENIYAYTYATPRTTRRERVEAVASRNTNIFNIVNINDLVGYVPGCYENHGMTMFYENEVDPVVSLYIMPMWLGTKEQPFRENAIATLANPCFHISLHGIEMGVVNFKRIEKYHLMPFYLEDIWRVMPEQIYAHDAGIIKMKSYYQQIISDLAHVVGGGTVYLAEYLVQLAGKIGEPIRSAVLESAANEVCMPLNLVNFFEQPVMDAPLEISCPVDVKIYDENGQLLGEVKDDEILSGSEHFILSAVGDKKSLLLLENKSYMIELTGYDTGTMDLQLMRLDGEGNPEAVAYQDVPVSPDRTLTAWVQNGVLTLFDDEQIVQPEILTGSDLKTVNIGIETDNETVTVTGAGNYVAGQQVLLMAASSDEDAVFAGWYEGDTLVATSAAACIAPDRSMTLTPKYLSDIEEDCILRLSCGSNSISATVVCSGSAVLYAAAYDDSGQMLWTGTTNAFTGTVTIPVPSSVMEQADAVRMFLLESRTLQPLCRYGS